MSDEKGKIVFENGSEHFIAAPKQPTPEMLERLAKSFHPSMEAQATEYLWKHFVYAVTGEK